MRQIGNQFPFDRAGRLEIQEKERMSKDSKVRPLILPLILFFTEWYLTAFADRYWAFSEAKDELLLSFAYLCFTFSLLAAVPTNKKRLCSLLYGLLISIILIWLIQAGNIINPYERLLNV